MNKAETARLLGMAAAYDYRTVGPADVEAWHAALGDVPFDAAREALIQHYRESTDRLMPAHLWRKTRPKVDRMNEWMFR